MNCCLLTEARAQLHRHHAVDDDIEELEVGKIKRQASLLTDNDARYAGRRVSRKDIEEQISAAGELYSTKSNDEFYVHIPVLMVFFMSLL